MGPGSEPKPVGTFIWPPLPYGTAFSGAGVLFSRVLEGLLGGGGGASLLNLGILVASVWISGGLGGSSLARPLVGSTT